MISNPYLCNKKNCGMDMGILLGFIFQDIISNCREIALFLSYRIVSVMNHVQILYKLDSMVTNITLDTLSIEHKSGYTYDATVENLEYEKF